MSQELKCWKLQSRSLKVVVIETWRMTSRKEAGTGAGEQEGRRGERSAGYVQDFGDCFNSWNRRRIEI